MLEELRRPNHRSRPLNQKEQKLVAAMVTGTPYADAIIEKLLLYRVNEMKDGEMGSLRFIRESGEDYPLGFSIAEAEFLDVDDIPVSIVINLDTKGEMYELDMWKIDFTPLKKFPEPSQIKLLRKAE
jgi:hypothetical protein